MTAPFRSPWLQKILRRQDPWENCADLMARALDHTWFGARTNHRDELLDFLDKKKQALAEYNRLRNQHES